MENFGLNIFYRTNDINIDIYLSTHRYACVVGQLLRYSPLTNPSLFCIGSSSIHEFWSSESDKIAILIEREFFFNILFKVLMSKGEPNKLFVVCRLAVTVVCPGTF